MKSRILVLLLLVIVMATSAEAVTFSLSQTRNDNQLYGPFFRGISVLDVDNDNDLDLIFGGYDWNNAGTIVYNNDGSGTYSIGQTLDNPSPDSTAGVPVGDIDNDGYIDLFASNTYGSNPQYIYHNNAGTFSKVQSIPEVTYSGGGMFGDVDNDGDLDLVMSGGLDSPAALNGKIYLNNGSGFFTFSNNISQNLSEMDLTGDVMLSDLDNDGDLDMVAFPGSIGTQQIYKNDGTGNFTLFTKLPQNVIEDYSMDINDFDGDGFQDIVITYNGGKPTTIYLNDGSSHFVEFSNLSDEALMNVAVSSGDIDNDGDNDLIIAHRGGTTGVYLNDGTGNFVSDFETTETDSWTQVRFVDVDNNGKLDFVLGAYNPGVKMEVYNNTIASTNTQPSAPTTFSSSYSNGKLTLTWNTGSDTETPTNLLMYNIKVGTTSGAQNIVSGVYGSPMKGNMQQRKSITLNIPNQDYYWSVQTIDSGLRASGWSTEQVYTSQSLPACTVESETRITTNTTDQMTPTIYEDVIVWEDSRNGNGDFYDVYMYNVSTGIETRITTRTTDEINPTIYGDIIVYGDYRNAGNPDIYFYNLSSQTESPLCTASLSQLRPIIDGTRVVWRDNRNGGSDIYMYDFATATEYPIEVSGAVIAYPRIDGNIIVWDDARSGNYEVYMYNISSSTETSITIDEPGNQEGPAVYSNIIVWKGANGIYMYNLSNGIESQISYGILDNYVSIYGNKIVWQDMRNGNFDIYMFDLSTGVETQITNNTAEQSKADIVGNKIVWQDMRNGNYDIYMAKLSAGCFESCTPNWTADSNLCQPDDLQLITYTDANSCGTTDGLPVDNGTYVACNYIEEKIIFVSQRDGNREIYIMNSDGSNQTRLTNIPQEDMFPAWSPDRTKIAFDSGGSNIFIMNADGSNITQLTSIGGNSYPAWSPDGKKIVFDSNRDGNREIYIMNSNGSSQTRLTYNSSVDYSPVWSPDGTKITFTSNRDGWERIYIMNPDGSNQSPLSSNPQPNFREEWSPDGTKIAFESDVGSNHWEVYVMDADGTNQIQLTNTTADNNYPAWSPDGSKIAFMSERDGNWEVYVMNPDGSSQTRLTNNPAIDYAPHWFTHNNIINNTPPTHTTPVLSSTFGTNLTTENLICYSQNLNDANGDPITTIFNWYVNNNPITALNMPFDIQSSTTAKDYSGNSNDGTITGAVWTSQGKSGGAMSFDGAGDYVEVGDTTTFKWMHGADNPSDFNFTISLWMQLDNPEPGDTYGLVSTGGGSSSYIGTGVWFEDYPTQGSRKLRLSIMNGVPAQYVALYSSPDNIYPFDTGWHMVTFTYNHALANNNVIIYVDGVEASRGDKNTATPSTSDSTYKLNIGSLNALDEFAGKIDDVKIYKKVLSAEQIYQDYIDSGKTNSTIVSQETNAGDEWKCSVTPNDGIEDGVTLDSNNLGIISCTPNWVADSNACQPDDLQQITYTDLNSCGSSAGLPINNGTYASCDYYEEKILYVSSKDGNEEIYIMNADGTNQTRLTNNPAIDRSPAWSPDRNKIVFHSYRDGNAEIYVMNADGSNQTRLTNNAVDDGSGKWSPDGNKIVFNSGRDGNYEIYVMNADGTNQTRLTNNPAGDACPSWSPDEKKIAFYSDRDGYPNREIYTINVNGTNQTRLTFNVLSDWCPMWSPDGTKIAFWSDRDGDDEIYVMNSDGTNQTRLTTSIGIDEFPSWSPDGEKIVFNSERDGNAEIYLINSNGSNPKRLTNNNWTDRIPYWFTSTCPDSDSDGICDSKDPVNGSVPDVNTTIPDFNLTIDGDYNLSQPFEGVLKVEFKQAMQNVAEFNFNFSAGVLNLNNITIDKQLASATKGYVTIKGVPLQQGATKTLYIDRINTSIHYLCIKDVEMSDISQISNQCNQANEYLLNCNGITKQGYTCIENGTKYVITGLKHSGVMQYQPNFRYVTFTLDGTNPGIYDLSPVPAPWDNPTYMGAHKGVGTECSGVGCSGRFIDRKIFNFDLTDGTALLGTMQLNGVLLATTLNNQVTFSGTVMLWGDANIVSQSPDFNFNGPYKIVGEAWNKNDGALAIINETGTDINVTQFGVNVSRILSNNEIIIKSSPKSFANKISSNVQYSENVNGFGQLNYYDAYETFKNDLSLSNPPMSNIKNRTTIIGMMNTSDGTDYWVYDGWGKSWFDANDGKYHRVFYGYVVETGANSYNIIGNLSDLSTNIIKNITVNGLYNLNQVFEGTQLVEFKDEKGNDIMKFYFNFSSGILNLIGVGINRYVEDGIETIVISNLNLDGINNKTVYLNASNVMGSVCVKDMEPGSGINTSQSCDGENEIVVPCDGTLTGGFICEPAGDYYEVSGLMHSIVSSYKEIEANQEGLAEGTESNSGGSGGGGGSGGYIPGNTPPAKTTPAPAITPPTQPTGEEEYGLSPPDKTQPSEENSITGAVVGAGETAKGIGMGFWVLAVILLLFIVRGHYKKREKSL